MKNEETFLEGSLVYLRKPDVQKDVMEGEWHQWFNDMRTTKYLVHGVFPLNREDEALHVRKMVDDPSSLLLAVCLKATGRHIGVISLKGIDWLNRCAEIGLVMGVRDVEGAALEAMALLTKHGFDRLNLIRIYCGQHEALWAWVNTLELIGYRIEGCRRVAGIRGGRAYDVLMTAITAEDFYRLQAERDGNILTASTASLLSRSRKDNLLPQVRDFFKNLYGS
jgi:RimJ/RimL family protein N-acetyltransferase